MTLNGKSDRDPDSPGRSTTPDQPSIAPDPGDGLSFRLKAAVWTWRLRIPRGSAGHRYLTALERQLAAHTARNLEAMLWQGWPPEQAEATAREWLHDLADTAARLALAMTEAPE